MLWVGPGRGGQRSFDLWVGIAMMPGSRSRAGWGLVSSMHLLPRLEAPKVAHTLMTQIHVMDTILLQEGFGNSTLQLIFN